VQEGGRYHQKKTPDNRKREAVCKSGRGVSYTWRAGKKEKNKISLKAREKQKVEN